MQNNFVNQFVRFTTGRWYWLMYSAGGVFLLAVALYYQYRLDTLPCVLCIHVRLWVALLVVVGVAGYSLHKRRPLIMLCHALLIMIGVALVERSYQLLGTERGFIEGSCNFDLGLPDWLAVEKWAPWLFRVETSCGYTPEIMFGITMAESLLVISVLMCIVALAVLVVAVRSRIT